MRIIIIGNGKLGQAIAAKAMERGHQIVATIDKNNAALYATFPDADVAIECSTPETAPVHLLQCLAQQLPVVCGTTGWYAHFEAIKLAFVQQTGSLLTATNFSVGVNILFALNQKLAQIMNQHPEYAPQILEQHHIHKLDAPSGTAITLAQDILSAWPHLEGWALDTDLKSAQQLPITAQRMDEAPGTHFITWTSATDELQLMHKAHSRAGFALGAVLAAEWLPGNKGVFGMADVLGI